MSRFYGVFIPNNSGIDQNSNGKMPASPKLVHLSLGASL